MGLVALVRLTKNRAVFPPINHVVVVAPPLGVLALLLTPTHPSFTSLSSMPAAAWSTGAVQGVSKEGGERRGRSGKSVAFPLGVLCKGW